MIGEILVLLAWGIAAGVAWWFRGTTGSEIKKKNPTLYESLKTDPENTLNTLIETEEKTKKTQEGIRDTAQAGLDEEEKKSGFKEGSSEHTACLQSVQQAKKNLKETEAKIKQMNTIKENGLDAFDWGWKNIAWTGGIFLGVGLLLHLIIKKVMKIFKSNE